MVATFTQLQLKVETSIGLLVIEKHTEVEENNCFPLDSTNTHSHIQVFRLLQAAYNIKPWAIVIGSPVYY